MYIVKQLNLTVLRALLLAEGPVAHYTAAVSENNCGGSLPSPHGKISAA